MKKEYAIHTAMKSRQRRCERKTKQNTKKHRENAPIVARCGPPRSQLLSQWIGSPGAENSRVSRYVGNTHGADVDKGNTAKRDATVDGR